MHVQMRGPSVGPPVTYPGISVTLPVPGTLKESHKDPEGVARGGGNGVNQGLHGPSRPYTGAVCTALR